MSDRWNLRTLYGLLVYPKSMDKPGRDAVRKRTFREADYFEALAFCKKVKVSTQSISRKFHFFEENGENVLVFAETPIASDEKKKSQAER